MLVPVVLTSCLSFSFNLSHLVATKVLTYVDSESYLLNSLIILPATILEPILIPDIEASPRLVTGSLDLLTE